MISQPSVTVVIATYNSALTVSAAVQSVLDQDYPRLELLIIDGASVDQTIELVNRFKDNRIRVFSEVDTGIYDAWNKGVKLATTDKIIFIGSDDTLGGVSAISNFWRLVPDDIDDCTLVYGDLVPLSSDGFQIGKVGGEWRDPWSFSGRHIWSTFPIPIMATFFDRNSIVEAGFFDSSLKIMADINLVLEIAKKSRPVYIPDCIVTMMGFGGISTRPESGALAMREAVKIRRSQGLGAYTNVEFLARVSQHKIKYWVSKYLGPAVASKMVRLLHGFKKLIFSKRSCDVKK